MIVSVVTVITSLTQILDILISLLKLMYLFPHIPYHAGKQMSRLLSPFVSSFRFLLLAMLAPRYSKVMTRSTLLLCIASLQRLGTLAITSDWVSWILDSEKSWILNGYGHVTFFRCQFETMQSRCLHSRGHYRCIISVADYSHHLFVPRFQRVSIRPIKYRSSRKDRPDFQRENIPFANRDSRWALRGPSYASLCEIKQREWIIPYELFIIVRHAGKNTEFPQACINERAWTVREKGENLATP